MKNTFLFAALALSIMASAQNFPAISGVHQQLPELLTTDRQIDSIYTWRLDGCCMRWTVKSKIINMVYDVSNNLVFFTSQIWDGCAWVNDCQITSTYDAINNLTSRLVQYWNGSAWMNSGQYNWTYDAKNNRTSEFYESPYGSYSFTWTYDASHNKRSEVYEGLSYYYTDKYKWNYLYDSNNNKIREVHLNWNSNTNAWVKDFEYRYTYTYDGKKNKTSEIKKQEWVDGTGVFLYKYTFTYDNNNNQISKFTGGWLGSALVNYLQDSYTFDANNNQTSHTYQELNESNWMVVDQWLYTYEYDNFKITESYKHFDLNDPDTFVTNGDSTHYYAQTITAVKDVKAEDGSINVFPNPSSGRFTISSNSAISAIEIYNLLGERVYSDSQFNYQTSSDIDLSDLGKGIYIINIYDGALVCSKKVVIQ